MKAFNTKTTEITRLILIFLLLFVGSKTQAASWYVSNSGNDTLNGFFPVFTSGYDGPKATIGNAMLMASAGDTIHIAAGTYPESVVVSNDIYFDMGGTVILKALTMNGTGNYLMLIGSVLDIKDSLRLTNGFVYLSDATVKLRTLPGALVVDGSANSYVEGRLYRALSDGSGTLEFPLGNAGDYRMALVDFHQIQPDSQFISMKMISKPAPGASPLPSGIRNISQLRYWDFGTDPSGKPTDYIFDLYYDLSVVDDGVFENNGLRILAKRGIKDWQSLGGAGNNTRTGHASSGFAMDSSCLLAFANEAGFYNHLGGILPFAKFSAPVICQKNAVGFVDASKNKLPAKIVRYHWDFGNGAATNDTSNFQNGTYTYTAAGTYTVKLLVFNDSALADSVEMNVTVHPLPVVKFGVRPVCYNDPSIWTDSTTVAAPDTIFSRKWSAGDGFTSTVKKPTHIYGTAGSYTSKLVVSTGAGCKDSATRTALVRSLPKLDFTPANGCSNDTFVYLRKRGMDPNESKFFYQWNIDGMLLGDDSIFRYRYNNAKAHDVTLIASDNFGCVNLVLKKDTSFGLPVLKFALDKTISGNDSFQCKTTNKFTWIPKVTASQNQTFIAAWKYGDGNGGTFTDSTHSYADEGTYKVTLSAITIRGCRDSVSHIYKVRGYLTPHIAKIGDCAPDSFTLYDSSSFSTSSIKSWKWILPGGAVDSGKTLRVWNKWATPPAYKLIVTNNEGCMDSATRTFTFTNYPSVSFNLVGNIPLCPGDSLKATVLGGTHYLWTTDSDTNSTKGFKSKGHFLVRVYNGPVCYVLDSVVIPTMHPAAKVTAKMDTTIVRNQIVNLSATGALTYRWIPGTGLSDSTKANPKAKPLVTTMYVVRGTDANGCKAYDTVWVKVVEPLYIRIPNLITPNGDGQNDYWVISDIKNLSGFDLTITDYAGKVLFTSSNYANDWNATKDGKELTDGIYYYKLKNRSTSETIKGFIQVIR